MDSPLVVVVKFYSRRLVLSYFLSQALLHPLAVHTAAADIPSDRCAFQRPLFIINAIAVQIRDYFANSCCCCCCLVFFMCKRTTVK